MSPICAKEAASSAGRIRFNMFMSGDQNTCCCYSLLFYILQKSLMFITENLENREEQKRRQ